MADAPIDRKAFEEALKVLAARPDQGILAGPGSAPGDLSGASALDQQLGLSGGHSFASLLTPESVMQARARAAAQAQAAAQHHQGRSVADIKAQMEANHQARLQELLMQGLVGSPGIGTAVPDGMIGAPQFGDAFMQAAQQTLNRTGRANQLPVAFDPRSLNPAQLKELQDLARSQMPDQGQGPGPGAPQAPGTFQMGAPAAPTTAVPPPGPSKPRAENAPLGDLQTMAQVASLSDDDLKKFSGDNPQAHARLTDVRDAYRGHIAGLLGAQDLYGGAGPSTPAPDPTTPNEETA